jgi:hypothetical protein
MLAVIVFEGLLEARWELPGPRRPDSAENPEEIVP